MNTAPKFSNTNGGKLTLPSSFVDKSRALKERLILKKMEDFTYRQEEVKMRYPLASVRRELQNGSSG